MFTDPSSFDFKCRPVKKVPQKLTKFVFTKSGRANNACLLRYSLNVSGVRLPIRPEEILSSKIDVAMYPQLVARIVYDKDSAAPRNRP